LKPFQQQADGLDGHLTPSGIWKAVVNSGRDCLDEHTVEQLGIDLGLSGSAANPGCVGCRHLVSASSEQYTTAVLM
ncbi:MAG TPA: hypothetical protein VL614_01280, partial [Acetobacteraceae bacterium]|nr:hypothetical protein [Acetobacteraceae bacterium]